MKKSSLLLATAIIASAGVNKAGAIDFTDKIYGKANAMIGVSADDAPGVSDTVLNIQAQGGFNVYYKLANFVHPFAGLRVGTNIPLTSEDMYGGGTVWTMSSLFYVDALLGAKFNITQSFALQPYYFLGYSLFRQSSDAEAVNVSRMSTGAGLDAIYNINDKFGILGGVEYKYIACGTYNSVDLKGATQFSIHFGVQFL